MAASFLRHREIDKAGLAKRQSNSRLIDEKIALSLRLDTRKFRAIGRIRSGTVCTWNLIDTVYHPLQTPLPLYPLSHSYSHPLLLVPIFSLARLRGIVECCSFLIKTGLIWTVRGSRSNQLARDSDCAIESISEKERERVICFSEKECRQNRTKQRLHVFQLERNRKSRYL